MLSHALILLAVLTPQAAVYVKGHSRAAERTRELLDSATCFRLGERPETAEAVLEVSHTFTKPGNPSVVMVLLDSQRKVLWEGKTSDDPWPLPSPVNRLLKRMGRAACPARDLLAARDSRSLSTPRPIPAK